jgi:hypothetical protein
VNLYGKASIVQAILEAERHSSLFIKDENANNRMDFAALSDTWFNKFMIMLGEGLRKGEENKIFDNVSFVVFNYDRCLEQFLVHALQPAYRISTADAQGICTVAGIHHPYGRVASMWPNPGQSAISFGDISTTHNYIELAKNIHTYTEQVANSGTVKTIQEKIAQADTLVFLGFAYYDANLALLRSDLPSQVRRIYGTALKRSEADKAEIRADLLPFLPEDKRWDPRNDTIRLEDASCSKLFDLYSKALVR